MADKTPRELIPQEGNEKVGLEVFKLVAEIMEDREATGRPQMWKRSYELGRNKPWKQKSDKVPLNTANLIYTHRERTVNEGTDNNPTFNVAPLGMIPEEKAAMFETLTRTPEYWWQDQEQQDVLEMSMRTGETYGEVFEKVMFNPTLEYGMGEIETTTIDPYHLGWVPVKAPFRKAEAILEFHSMTLREAKRRWPKFAKDLKSDNEHLKDLGDDRREIMAGSSEEKSTLATIGGAIKTLLGNHSTGKGETEELLVVECWVKDRTKISTDEPVYNEAGEQVGVRRTTKPKYPGEIRRILTCNAGKIVLEDKPNPSINPTLPIEEAAKTYLFDKFPYSWTPSIKDTGGNHGICDIEQLESLQQEIHKTISQVTLFKDKAARLMFVNPKDSGVSNSHITNYPKILNPTTSYTGQGLRWVDPPQFPADLTNFLEIYKDLFYTVAGTFDLDQAKAPGRNVIAYKAIAALLERAKTMRRAKIRNYDRMIRERGRMFLSCMMNWYAEDRMIAYELDGKKETAVINGHNIIVPAKLTVVSGSTMPISRVQLREEAIELAKGGWIDQVALLKALNYEDWPEIVKRMQAGPFGEFMGRLEALGTPPSIIQFLSQLGSMDPKDFEKAAKAGELPQFMQLIQQALQGGQGQDPTQQTELAGKQAEVGKTQAEIAEKEAKAHKTGIEAAKVQAEIAKIEAETRLFYEKIATERINQEVALFGTQLDSESLKIKRAQLVNDIEMEHRAAESKDREIDVKSAHQYEEKGMKSNNKDATT